MNAYHIEDDWGLDNLRPTTRPLVEPGRGQVRLAVRAAALNFRDSLVIEGQYNPRFARPLVPLSDGVGVVEAVGAEVTRVAIGDRVCATFCTQWPGGEPSRERLSNTRGGPVDGMLQTHVVLGQDELVSVPEHLTDVEAATLPCAAVTAWSALVSHGGLRSGQTVLVQGSGGVSVFALQIAKAFGCRVIATTGSASKEERLRALGADHVINYRSDSKWGRSARSWAGGEGVDHVVEVGGAGTLSQSLKAIRPGGAIAVIGVLSGTSEPLNILPILMQNVRLQGILVGNRDAFEALNQCISANKIRPVVDRVFPFEEAANAFRHLRGGSHIGKVVVAMP